ncbi:DegT/DnrJ/EryC1/StrS family aminotransferase [Pantoea ananatis]|uniref:DegT/DnrJ/EryC1/StrS family aminotransferase n=1 Tax=Pantoea ananas TaxID=553 RepID=UPI000F895E82|nr:DegT/DnrJ/EryC1/StrS family aminotransferase [Pantoea ananatis]RQN07059.1 hypothetical protein EHQ51_20340 [Pantoea ananatis]
MSSPDWILTDDVFMKPSYRISPFNTSSIATNSELPLSNECDELFASKFPGYQQQYLLKARHGITLALQSLSLNAEDKVTILTTTGNLYVSGCVTKAVEKVCKWERVLDKSTKAIVVIHEFGKVYSDMDSIYQLGLPVIEDYAHSYNSQSTAAGKGDYILYSFPKYYPVQFGGILLSKHRVKPDEQLTEPQSQYIKNVVSAYYKNVDQIAKVRWDNYHYLVNAFALRSVVPRFSFDANETPSVFLFCAPKNIDLNKLKSFVQYHGVECSVFYGEQAFFLPCHEKLSTTDLDYFIYLYDVFVSGGHS